jgi:hypothetical protein
MSKYYTRKECFKLCGDNDIPFIEGAFNASEQRTMSELKRGGASGYNFFDIIKWADYDKWQIKRAGPKVLSAEESFEKDIIQDQIRDCQEWNGGFESGYLTGFGDGDKNGQNREYYSQEQKELRDIAREIECQEFDHDIGRLCRAIRNLKPPYERDNG